MCKHSVIYQIENEEHGGIGCPICNAEQRCKMPPAGACETCGLDLTDFPARPLYEPQIAEVRDAG